MQRATLNTQRSFPPNGGTANSGEPWAEPDIGPAWRHRFVAWLVRLGGRARAEHIAVFAALWYVLFYPSIRRRCRYYLNRRFPQRRRWHQRLRDDFRLVRSYAGTLADMLVTDVLGAGAMQASSPEHEDLIARCTKPQGFVLLHAHVGCFQIGMSTLAQFPKKVAVVTIPDPLTKAPGEMIDPRDGLAAVTRMTQCVLNGEILAMMGDRVFGSEQNAVRVRFLGGEALFPITPYRVASATGSAVLVMTAPKLGRSKYELRVAKVIEVAPGLGRNAAAYAPYAQQYADCIEAFAQEFPWQVFNFYDMWANSDV